MSDDYNEVYWDHKVIIQNLIEAMVLNSGDVERERDLREGASNAAMYQQRQAMLLRARVDELEGKLGDVRGQLADASEGKKSADEGRNRMEESLRDSSD